MDVQYPGPNRIASSAEGGECVDGLMVHCIARLVWALDRAYAVAADIF